MQEFTYVCFHQMVCFVLPLYTRPPLNLWYRVALNLWYRVATQLDVNFHEVVYIENVQNLRFQGPWADLVLS